MNDEHIQYLEHLESSPIKKTKKNGCKNDDEAATSTGLRFNPSAKKKEDTPTKPSPRSRKPPPSRD